MNNTEVYEMLNEMCVNSSDNQQIYDINLQQIELVYKTYINY